MDGDGPLQLSLIVKLWSKSKSKPLSQQTPKSNKSPPKKRKKKDLDLAGVLRDTSFSEVYWWRGILILLLQKYGKIYFLRAICQKKCLKLKIRAPLQGKNSFWYTWQFRSHIWISQGCFWLHLSVTNCSQSSSFPALLFKVILFWKFRGISLSFLLL